MFDPRFKVTDCDLEALSAAGSGLFKVTDCDLESRRFIQSELEHEVLGKSAQVPFDGLIKHLDRHSVELGKIAVEHHLLSAQDQDNPFNVLKLARGSSQPFVPLLPFKVTDCDLKAIALPAIPHPFQVRLDGFLQLSNQHLPRLSRSDNRANSRETPCS
jgi:hypothetical protein